MAEVAGANILYITYDGLTDFIGQSQVLPYILGCARKGSRFTVISFEKPERLAAIGAQVDRTCRDAGIDWRPQKFRSSPPYVAKFIDQLVMYRAAKAASEHGRFDLLHCRSYAPAMAGLAIKRRQGIPLIFDMRGFWPDQRREGGRWRDASPIGRRLYSRWKRNEAQLITEADHIVSLTHAAREEILGWASYRGAPISVIPCCADFEHFTVADEMNRMSARQHLEIDPDAPVLAYLGSIGTVYMVAEHLRLFEAIRRRDGRAKAMFIGRNQLAEISEIAGGIGIAFDADDMRVVHAERDQVPFWLGAANAGSCFIIPSYSSNGVSPTKLAEYLACGVPVIANRSVGDVEHIVGSLGAGHVMKDFSDNEVKWAADAFMDMRTADGSALRSRARSSLDLPNAVSAYLSIYDAPEAPVTVASW